MWASQASVSWNSRLPWAVTTGWPVHPSRGVFMELRPVVDGIWTCPFSSDSLFGCVPGLILGAYIGAHLWITPGLGALQVTLDLPESSRFSPFPATSSTCGHNALPGQFGVQLPTCCPGHDYHWSLGSCSTWLHSPASPPLCYA